MITNFESHVHFSGISTEMADVKNEMIVLFQFLSLFTQPHSEVGMLKAAARTWLSGLKYFKFGFGSTHMWIHQVTPEGVVFENRLLIVRF